jgi:hypothetical protein
MKDSTARLNPVNVPCNTCPFISIQRPETLPCEPYLVAPFLLLVLFLLLSILDRVLGLERHIISSLLHGWSFVLYTFGFLSSFRHS